MFFIVLNVYNIEEIKSDYQNGKIVKPEVIKRLFLMLDNTSNDIIRIEVIKTFRKLNLRNEKIYKCFENLTISDASLWIKAVTLKEIINLVNGYGILTVGETSDMLESGGVVNFLVEKNKVRFEINLTAARDEKLTIRSQLLRLATKVIDEKNQTKK